LRRLQKRARGEELDIDISYLTLLHNKHEKWLMDNRIREYVRSNIMIVSQVLCRLCSLRLPALSCC